MPGLGTVTICQSAPKEELVRVHVESVTQKHCGKEKFAVQEVVVELEIVAVVHEADVRRTKGVGLRDEKL